MNSRAASLCAAVVLSVVGAAGCEPSGPADPPIESTAPPSADAVLDLVGPACVSYVKEHTDGGGSPAELAEQQVATAIENHPDLTTFADAISGGLNKQVDLVDELNGGEFTVFAPTDKAFAKLPKKWLESLAEPSSADALTDLLLYHLAVGERPPDEIAGTIETRGGAKIKVTRDGERIRVADQANVTCGGLTTANATIYLVDSVLMPPAS